MNVPTYQEILDEMLDRVPKELDQREGSVIWDALAPAAAQLAQAYADLDAGLKDIFLTEGSEETLITRGEELGIERHEAIAAKVKGEFNLDIPIGTRFNLDSVNYEVTEVWPNQEAMLTCETAGSIGNRTGTLLPIDYVDGLTTAKITEILEPGEDQESVDHYRSRVLEYLQRPVTSGNRYQYEMWAKEVAGVGGALCQPLWDGPGTVKVLVTDAEMQPATEALCQEVADYIEDVRPIGAEVSIAPPGAKQITVTVTLTLAAGAYLETVRQALEEKIRDYLAGLVFVKNYVSFAMIGSLMLDTEGVTDYEALTINGSAANIPLEDGQIPVLEGLEVSV